MAKIKKILAREILDSRGIPTIEVKIFLDQGEEVTASVPAGTSRGTYEMVELRDADFTRYDGKGVLKACQNIREIIAPQLSGFKVTEQQAIDRKMIELDGTKNKSLLGGNAILAVSLACSRAGAKVSKKPLYQYLREIFGFKFSDFRLPTPLFNLINGGRHADSNLEIQEFLVIPKKSVKFSYLLQIISEIFQCLKGLLKSRRGTSKSVGEEGGLTPFLNNNEESLKFLNEAVQKCGYKLGEEIFFGLDCAASEFYDQQQEVYKFEKKLLSTKELMKIYENWLSTYPLIFLEDPLEENDFNGWQKMTGEFLKKWPFLSLVGDDIFVTNLERFNKGLRMKIANALIIKPNQVGTILETMECIKVAQKNNYQIVISNRSGETNDTFIADLAVAVNANFIKAGGVTRGERIAKYNRLLEIEEELSSNFK